MALKDSIQHLIQHVSKKTQQNNVSNIFNFNNKDKRRMSVATIINFEHFSHFILLLLNSNK